MRDSRTFRVLFLGTLLTAIVAMLVLAAVLLWPEWRKYQAVQRLRSDFDRLIALADDDVQLYSDAFDAAQIRVKEVKKVDGGATASEFLIPMLKNDRAKIRMYGAVYLGLFGPDAKNAVPALIEALKDEHNVVRVRAAIALRYIGPDARAAVPALINALQDENGNVSFWSAHALKRIDRNAAMEIVRKDAEDRGFSQRIIDILLADPSEEDAAKKMAF